MPTKKNQAGNDKRDVSSYHISTSRRRLLHIFGVGSIAGLAGCAGGENQGTDPGTETGPPKDTETERELRQSATLAVRFDITDNFDNWGGVSEYYTRIFEPLTWATQDLNIKPNLATEWRATGEKTWEFDIREDVRFHNGKPLNADAVVFSLKEMLKQADYVPVWANTKPEGVKKVDDMTIEVTNTRPYPNFPGHLTHLNFVIQHPDRTMGNPIGTGPYKFESREKGHHVTVSAFDDYWGEAPHMGELTYRIIGDENTRALALEGGRVDLALELPPSQFDAIQKSKGNKAVTQSMGAPIWATFEVKKPTTDLKLRQALNYAVSQEAVVEGSQNGVGVPATGPIPDIIWWSAHDSLPTYGPDKTNAKHLVEESNYKGETLKLLGRSGGWIPSPELIGQIVQQAANDIGVEMEIKFMERGAFSEAKENNEGHLYLTFDYIPYAGSLYIFNFDPARNYFEDFEGFKDLEEIRSLASKAVETPDPGVKKDALRKAQHILMDNAYIIPLFYQAHVTGMDKDFGEMDFHPFPTNGRWEKLQYYK